jgi:hypothetical protein
MYDKDKELEKIQYNQMEFLVNCALLGLSSEDIDAYVMEIEAVRRDVIT